MIVDKLVEKLHIRSNFMKLIAGSVLTALVIALGMVGILKLFSFSINPVIPAVLGVVGGAIYATVTRK
jgi:zinc transporter ZupT